MQKINLNNTFFTENRRKLSTLMLKDSAAIINSNDIMPTNADGELKYLQNSDLYYLTGIEQEETILMLNPGNKDEDLREILFIRDYNSDLEVWEGKKHSTEEASVISGIKTVMELSKFEHILHDIMCSKDNIYLNTNDHDRAGNTVESRDIRFINFCKKRYPLHTYHRISPLIYSLREVKSPIEIELIQKACDITGDGFRRLLKFVKPGVMEYEVQAELAHEFIRQGSDFADYEPIIASGENSCFLHYVKNDDMCNDNDILLLDFGANYANYNADMTRTIPVNGKFTTRQKQVYNSVLRALNGTIKEMKPGISGKDLMMVTRELIAKELVDLKLLTTDDVRNIKNKSPEFKKYYPHDVSHFLGLGVHDVGLFDEPIKAGMVLTCEPGIYISEEKLGVRLENDILITQNGCKDFMSNFPVDADEIEELMK